MAEKNEPTIRVQCSKCGNVWDEPVGDWQKKVVVHRTENGEAIDLRVQCPVCHNYTIITIPREKLP